MLLSTHKWLYYGWNLVMINDEDPPMLDDASLEDSQSEEQSKLISDDLEQVAINYLPPNSQLSAEKLDLIEQKLKEYSHELLQAHR